MTTRILVEVESPTLPHAELEKFMRSAVTCAVRASLQELFQEFKTWSLTRVDLEPRPDQAPPATPLPSSLTYHQAAATKP